MKRGKFLEFEKSHRGIIFGHKAYFGLTWAEYAKFTKLVGELNFGCGIKKGICVSEKSYNGRGKKCCCYSCRDDVGYIDRLPKQNTAINSVAKVFNEKNGFWRKDKGCILPRKYRSKICILHRCESAQKNFIKNHIESNDYHRESTRQAFIMHFIDYARLYNHTEENQIAKIVKALIY